MKNTLFLILSLILLLSANVLDAKPEKNKGKQKSLPPGLQKKVDKGQELPPGWQKKLKKGDILEQRIFQHGQVVIPADKLGIITIKVDGTLLKLHEKTHKIIDILTHH